MCPGDTSWEKLDERALTGFNEWTNTSAARLSSLPQYKGKSAEVLSKAISQMDLQNASSPCAVFLRQMHCALHFPVCEIGREFSRLCMKSCKKATKKQCPALSNICDQVEPSEIASKGKCFRLSYNGPAVGMWVAGFTISLIFSILNSVGINLQKLSMARNEESGEKKGTFRQPLWVLGFALVCLGSILDFVAFGMAPQTLLAPLAALSLVWNMFIAPIFHKEEVTRENILATIIIFIGVTLTVIFAGHSTPTYELEDLLRLYQQPVMSVYIICVTSFLAGLFYFARYIEHTHKYEGGLYHIICYGGIAGTFGGQSVLLAKSTVELLKSAIWGQSGWYMFTHFASYVIIGGLLCCLVCQIHFLNGGLARFDALIVVPVYQSFWILMSVLGGIMYFEEYVSMTSMQLFMFTLGGFVTIGGIIVLLKTRQKREGGKKYLELSVTPSSVWTTDDSEEEEIELHIRSPPSEGAVSPSPEGSTEDDKVPRSQEQSPAKKDTNGIDPPSISSAIYRTSEVKKQVREHDTNNRIDHDISDEEEDFI